MTVGADRPGTAPVIVDSQLRRLYEYWLGKKGDRAAPARADIAPEEIPDLLPWIFLIETVGDRLRVRLAGSSVTGEYGGQLTGAFVDEVDLDHVTARAIGEYRKSARDFQPIASKWQYQKKDGRHLDYERLILPLSADGRTVDMFLCGAMGHGFG